MVSCPIKNVCNSRERSDSGCRGLGSHLNGVEHNKGRAIQLYLLAFSCMNVNILIKVNSTEHNVNSCIVSDRKPTFYRL